MPNILIVEDDTLIRDTLVRRLQLEGYQVSSAQHGAQAIAITRTETVDLVVMDMGLPIMNGWQATQRIRSHRATAMLPIVALTAYTLSDERLRCFQIGCNDYEPKPFDFDRLLRKIEVLLHAPVAANQHSGDTP